MRRLGLWFLVALQAAVYAPDSAVGQSGAGLAAELPPLIDRQVFFGDPEIAGAQISPNGEFISFLRPYRDVLNIWVKGIDEPFDAARPVTADTARPVRGYFWSQDGSRILYVQDKGGNENFHVYAVDPATEPNPATGVPPAHDLTPYEGVRAFIYALPENTPNTILVGLNERDPRYHDVYRLNLRTGERELIIQNDEQITGWIADLEGSVRLAARVNAEGGTEVLRIDDGEFVEVYSCTVEETCNPIRFSADGERVYMITNKGSANLTRLVLFDPETEDTELVHEDPEEQVDVAGFEFSDQTNELVAVYYMGDRLRTYPMDDRFRRDFEAVKAAVADGEIMFGASTEDERLHLVSVASDIDPGATYLYDRATGEVELLYRSRPDLPSEHLAQMEPVRYTVRDGEVVPAYLTVPKGVQRTNLPTVVLIHGGPWARVYWGYNPIAQFLANRGYAVLQPNFRGSTGYGERWLNLGNGEWGTGTMQHDITDGVQWLIEEGIADPDNVAIMGGSYGGFATLAGVAFTPDLYAAGVDIVGPSNIVTLLNSVPPYWAAAKKIFAERVGDLEDPEDLARLKRQSPFFSAEAITAPLLVIQGANDPRVKKAESDQIVIALRDLDRTVEYLVAPNEGHGFAGRENRLAMFAEIEAFLAENLGGRFQESVAPAVEERLNVLAVAEDTLELKPVARLGENVQPLAFDGTRVRPATLEYAQTVELQGQTLELTATRTITAGALEGDSAWLLVESADTPMGTAVDSVYLHKETLVPLERIVHQGPATIRVAFGADSVTGAIQAPGREIPISLAVDEDVYLSGAPLQLAIATLPLAPGYISSFSTFDLLAGQTSTYRLDVLETETVEVPMGTFDAVRVEIIPLEGGSDGSTLWFAKDAPHRLIRAEVSLPAQAGGGTAVIELSGSSTT